MWDLIVSVPDHCLSFYLTCVTTKGGGGNNKYRYDNYSKIIYHNSLITRRNQPDFFSRRTVTPV